MAVSSDLIHAALRKWRREKGLEGQKCPTQPVLFDQSWASFLSDAAEAFLSQLAAVHLC